MPNFMVNLCWEKEQFKGIIQINIHTHDVYM